MTLEEKAKDIAKLIVAENFECAKAAWTQHTTGMISRDIVKLRDQIGLIESRLIAGFEDTINAETGEL